MQNNEIFAIVITAFIWVIAIVIMLLAIGLSNALSDCNNLENPACFMFTCSPDGVNGLTKTCGEFAYRCDGNMVRCSNEPEVLVENQDPGEICVQGGNFDQCKESS